MTTILTELSAPPVFQRLPQSLAHTVPSQLEGGQLTWEVKCYSHAGKQRCIASSAPGSSAIQFSSGTSFILLHAILKCAIIDFLLGSNFKICNFIDSLHLLQVLVAAGKPIFFSPPGHDTSFSHHHCCAVAGGWIALVFTWSR